MISTDDEPARKSLTRNGDSVGRVIVKEVRVWRETGVKLMGHSCLRPTTDDLHLAGRIVRVHHERSTFEFVKVVSSPNKMSSGRFDKSMRSKPPRL